MLTKHVIVVFLDGVGLGAADSEANPFMHAEMPALQALLGVANLTREVAGTMTGEAALLGLDATLGVPGLPQSATGQTTILTGLNAPAAVGEHYGPYPSPALREMLAQEGIFRTLLQAGLPVAYANAYPTHFLERLQRGKGRLSANTQAAVLAGLKLRSGEDLRRGRAIAALLSNDFWPEPEVTLPPLNAHQAGEQLVALAQDHALTYFEFWYSDLLGHRQDRVETLKVLRMLDEFLGGILANMDGQNSLLLVVSDHGNLEDWTTNKHTLNSAFTLLAGAGGQTLAPRLRSLLDIKPAILEYLLGTKGTEGIEGTKGNSFHQFP
ncbi:MAG: peptidase [Anaerolineae bacterium]